MREIPFCGQVLFFCLRYMIPEISMGPLLSLAELNGVGVLPDFEQTAFISD